ncbi:MAG: FAD:protein FMN transferase [Gammaproteobacteria bacterium]|nr:FAD:protein FMN transferase [Gammaproteobacteria bacterium]
MMIVINVNRVVLLVICVALSACSKPKSAAEAFTGQAFGTAWSVQVTDLRPDLSRTIMQERIEQRIDLVDDLMSTWRDDTEVMRFNNSTSTDWFSVSPAVAAVLAEALAISRLSEGAFDISVGPLVDLWGFGATEQTSRRPSREAIRDALAATGYQKISFRLHPPAVRKTTPGLAIDLSGIAKGFAVDQIAQLMDELGSRNYLVEIGGEIRAMGLNSRGKIWRVGIERPGEFEEIQFEKILPLANLAMATSGDYRNYFELGSMRYSHTIDPRTGRPVTHKLASVSVIADNAMRADALATAILVMGPKKGLELAREKNIKAFLIERDENNYKTINSPAMFDYLAGTETSN